ncbi:transmembrane anchor protein [Sphingomonas kaistensis]|uniref:Transmembrane anchor protein n=1 Tax=Sphingomonas kaistensis TaxID=298708 RepID=A0ABZ2G3S7_9SPHN
MFNSQRPSLDDLPTANQLAKATVLSLTAAAAILVAMVLPAEYAIDPTGVGRTLGFTQMGELKAQLAEEVEADAALRPRTVTTLGAPALPATTPVASASRNDVTKLTLAPGEGAEVKVSAGKGARVRFAWEVAGGRVNYDTHGDPISAPKGFYHGYGKGKQSAGEQGELVAAFDGKHGWFWRNRSDQPVTVTLRTGGQYSEVRRLV